MHSLLSLPSLHCCRRQWHLDMTLTHFPGWNLVATKISLRSGDERTRSPTIFSERPLPYVSAVSNNLRSFCFLFNFHGQKYQRWHSLRARTHALTYILTHPHQHLHSHTHSLSHTHLKRAVESRCDARLSECFVVVSKPPHTLVVSPGPAANTNGGDAQTSPLR